MTNGQRSKRQPSISYKGQFTLPTQLIRPMFNEQVLKNNLFLISLLVGVDGY